MDLFKYLPQYYENNTDMKNLQDLLNNNIEDITKSLNLAIDQSFINTSTYFLSRYEKIFDLKVDVTKSNEFRRERIRAKLRGQGTTTKEMIKQVASSYSNGAVEIIEDFANYKFIVKFVGEKGIPSNMEDLTLTIQEIKPGHLDFEFQYTYTTWNEIKNKSWNNLSTLAWNEIKEREVL